MKAPFSQSELFGLAARYNHYIEPLQILIYIPTLLIFALLLLTKIYMLVVLLD